jgi:hypothetical protein
MARKMMAVARGAGLLVPNLTARDNAVFCRSSCRGETSEHLRGKRMGLRLISVSLVVPAGVGIAEVKNGS